LNLLMPAVPGDGESGNYRWHEAVQRVAGLRQESLLQYLSRKGLWKGYPVAEGETLQMTGIAGNEDVDAQRQVLLYEVYDAEDMKSDTENGSKSASYMFLNYGNCGAAINTNGDSLYTTSASPTEFPSFPFGQV
ncbi:unnamed protein product, partial [marine sediment metagenome]